jgi:hypothetical protein
MVHNESPPIEKFFTESHRRSYDQGKAEGKVEGKAEALLVILQQRKLEISDEQRRQIAACPDVATLDRWLDRALSARSVDELLA